MIDWIPPVCQDLATTKHNHDSLVILCIPMPGAQKFHAQTNGNIQSYMYL